MGAVTYHNVLRISTYFEIVQHMCNFSTGAVTYRNVYSLYSGNALRKYTYKFPQPTLRRPSDLRSAAGSWLSPCYVHGTAVFSYSYTETMQLPVSNSHFSYTQFFHRHLVCSRSPKLLCILLVLLYLHRVKGRFRGL